jgi:hypothetical protein
LRERSRHESKSAKSLELGATDEARAMLTDIYNDLVVIRVVIK